MKKTALLVAGAILAGTAVVYLFTKGTNKADDASPPEPHLTFAEPAAPVAVAEADDHLKPAPVHPEPKPAVAAQQATVTPPSAWSRLAEKYGPEKTALSARITSNITSVIDRGMELANTWATNSGSATVAEAASKQILRSATTQLGLSEDQQQQTSALIQNLIGKRMNAVTDLTSAMRTEPEQIMDMLLAGDALARGQITQQQYDEITLPTRTMLQNLSGFIMGQQPGATGIAQLVGDEATAAKLQAILTPEQQAKLTQIAATANERIQARRARNVNNPGLSIQNGQIPIMELDKLDQSVAAVQKMTEAAKLMMEGMKGLKEANPQTGARP